MKTRIILYIILLFMLTPATWAQQKTYVIDISKKYQQIENFGASDCWTAQFFGLFPDEKRNQMADWLFSMDTNTNGQPKGIGLSLWRFNIGSGSAELGKNSYIGHVTRRAECFQLPNGEYDWNKQKGQRWFLQAAKKRGVENFLAFSLSAPTQMTQNGLSNNRFRPKDGTFNIKADKYDDFADFLVTTIDELQKREGIKFDYLSPFNEPEWNWDGNTTQEGTPAQMSEIAKTVRLINEKMESKNINTEILVTESGCIEYLYKHMTEDKKRDNQIDTFFNPQSENYIGNLSRVPKKMVGHSYWTTAPNEVLYEKRMLLKNKLDEYKLDYWHTELCIMSNDKEIGGGGYKDLTMKTALYVARIIHHDLCVAGSSVWQWWLGMTNSNYKDGLVYVTPNDELTDGEISDSKLMWSLGNYSRFVRPGAQRLDVSSKTNVNDPIGLMISSYIHEKDKKLIIVAINYSDKPQKAKFEIQGTEVKSLTPYVTSDKEGDNLKPYKEYTTKSPYSIPAKSIVTFVGQF